MFTDAEARSLQFGFVLPLGLALTSGGKAGET